MVMQLTMMHLNAEFSSNRHAAILQEFEVPVRHPELCFEDANLAVVTGRQYFLVHQGPLCHHSSIFRELIGSLQPDDGRLLEGRPVLPLQDSTEDMTYFLRALYGFCLNIDSRDFLAASALLRVSTKYGVEHLRKEAIRAMTLSWPTTLPLWEAREQNVTNADGFYAPRSALPHPILIIELAHEVKAPELLPSAFYDLSRYLPSQLAVGHTSPIDGTVHQLAVDDLLKVLRGKEQAARFFSTFVVNELEGRAPSQWCLHRNELHMSSQRACQIAFEAITFDLIRDINGMVCNRNSDPLFAIAHTVVMQTKEDVPGMENKALYRACESCRLEYGAVVDAIREDFWRRIPEWFELEVPNWG